MGETRDSKIQRAQETLNQSVIHDGLGASLARGSHCAPSGTTVVSATEVLNKVFTCLQKRGS